MYHLYHHNKQIIAHSNLNNDRYNFLHRIKEISLKNPECNTNNTTASMIIYGGDILTLADSHEDNIEAIAIAKDRIIAVGNLKFLIKHFKHDDTHMLNLQGKTMVPGFIDPHVHVLWSAIFSNFININQFNYKTVKELHNIIEYHAKTATAGSFIAFQGFDPAMLAENFNLSIQMLDKIAPNNPVIIMHTSMNRAYLNSAAFTVANINKNSMMPKGGKFLKDNKGELTGEIIAEPAISIFLKYVIKITPEQYLQAINDIFYYANQVGCTSLHDAALGLMDLNLDLAAISAALCIKPTVRLSAFLFTKNLDDVNHAIALNLAEFNKKFFRIVGLKANVLNYNQQELNEMIITANKHNWQYGLDANDESAIDMAISAFEVSYQENSHKELRNRIDHCSLCRDSQLSQMSQFNISPTFLMNNLYYFGDTLKTILDNNKINLLDRCQSAINNNLKISLHSDYNITPINPLLLMHIAVNRSTYKSREQINQNECISAFEALKAITINAAWQCQIDDIVGSLAVGKLADFVILEHNPLKIDKNKIKDIKILQTWVGGKKVYSNI
jgi:predicted amidohydrolase YtcJ